MLEQKWPAALLALMVAIGAQDPAKAPIPPDADQAQALKLVRDVFKADLAKNNPADRKVLAKKMIDQGRETKGDAASQYVLLREGRELANQIGDLPLALEAIDETSKRFEVDASALRSAALAAAAKAAKTPEDSQAVAAAALKMADAALRRDEHDAAEKLLSTAAQSARKAQDAPLAARITTKTKEAADLKTRFAALKKAKETLATNPEDAAANLALGRFHCLVKGSWAEGLPLLAKGSDAALRERAENDLKNPGDAPGQAAIGDEWWELGEKETAGSKEALRERAAMWYARALPKLAGLNRSKVEKRLSEHTAARLARGTWLDCSDPKIFGRSGKPGESVDVKGQLGYQTTTTCRDFPKGSFDGITVRMILDPAAKARGYIMVEAGKAAFADCDSGMVGFARKDGPTVPWTPEFKEKSAKPEDCVFTILLVDGEYILYIDNLEKGRSKTSETVLKSLAFNTYYGDVKLERIKLRRLE